MANGTTGMAAKPTMAAEGAAKTTANRTRSTTARTRTASAAKTGTTSTTANQTTKPTAEVQATTVPEVTVENTTNHTTENTGTTAGTTAGAAAAGLVTGTAAVIGTVTTTEAATGTTTIGTTATETTTLPSETTNNDIYADIAKRTQGDIYIGVVGPVRTGKSTFIKRFMEALVIPNISSDYRRERAVDELPQSAAGKTIMTTEPKFIPEEAVEIAIEDAAKFRVRMIDCVGYIIPSAIGYFENQAPRMVMTPWFDSEIPFNMAAEVGTQKVISEHSTIGLVITTDGTITDLPRAEYQEAEERVINELKQLNKPFVVLLNSVRPRSPSVREMASALSDRYGATVIPVNCLDLDESDIQFIMTQVLYAFPVKEINIEMPTWINSLDKGHWLKEDIFSYVKSSADGVSNLRDVKQFCANIQDSANVTDSNVQTIDLGTGSAVVRVTLKTDLFFKIVGEATGLDIRDESDLMPQILSLVKVNSRYSKIADALREVEETGYGIVMPSMDELELDEPEIIKQGGKYGIKLRATAPSIHMLRANITTEVSPIVGSEKQSEELVLYMLNDFEESPQKIWESNIFGKSLHELVNEGLQAKLMKMPADARMKLQEAIERIINEGCAGLICFIL